MGSWHQSIPAAPSPPPPPPGFYGAFARLVSPWGWAFGKFCTVRGPGICQPRGHFWAFDTHAVSYQNISTQKVLLEKTQIASFVKDRNKLKRVVKACSPFHACISSLFIKQEFIHSENRSCRCESTFFGYWIKFLLILFEEHPFIFIKRFVTYNVTVNVNNFISILTP